MSNGGQGPGYCAAWKGDRGFGPLGFTHQPPKMGSLLASVQAPELTLEQRDTMRWLFPLCDAHTTLAEMDLS